MWPLKEARMSPGVPTRSFRWRLLSLAGSRARAEGPWCQPRAAVAAGPQNARLNPRMAPQVANLNGRPLSLMAFCAHFSLRGP